MQKTEKILNSDLTDLAKLYLLNGNNYLIDKFIKKFKNKFINQNMQNFNFEIIEEGNQSDLINKLINSISLLPLQAEKRIVFIYPKNLNKKSLFIKNIDKIIANLPETTSLFLIYYDNLNKRRKYLKPLLDLAEFIKFKDLKYKNLDDWIKKRVAAENKEIEPEAIKLLESSFNNNLHRLENELTKIINFVDQKKVLTKEDVTEVISGDLYLKENAIFDFVDALGRKNKSVAINLLSEMLTAGGSPKHILLMIERQFRLILQIKILYDSGHNIEQIAKIINEHPYPVKKCFKQSNNFSTASLKKSFSILHITDINLVSKGNPELEMELLLLNLINLK